MGDFRIASLQAPGDTPLVVNQSKSASHSYRFVTLASLLLGGLTACATGTAEGVDAGKPDVNGPDAMIGGRADAALGIQADASPAGTADATDAAPPADADPNCTPVTANLLANADFDLGPGSWTETSGGGFAIITSDTATGGVVAADSGTFIAWLGGYSPTGGATDLFFQDVAVPAEATPITVSGKIWIDTAEILGLAFDTLDLELVNATSGVVLESLQSWSNLDSAASWVSFSANLSGSYAGQTVRLRFTGEYDSSQSTHFLLDTLVMETTSCP